MPAPSNANGLTLGRPLIETALIDAAHDLESLKYALRTQLENLALSLTGMGWPSGAQGSDAVYQSVYYADSKFWGGVPTDPLNPDELFDPATAGGDAFKTIVVSGQDDVVADASEDTLTLVAGSNVTITTNAGTDTITIAASGDTGYGTIQEEGTPVTQRDTINFVGAATVTDDAGNSRTNVTITDADTTYTAGTYLDLAGTTFNVDLTEVADYDGGESQLLANLMGTISWVTGSGGGGTTFTLFYALVNDATHVTGSDGTLDFDGTSAIIGTAPSSGTAVNTYSRAFIDNEPILIVGTDAPVYYAVKIRPTIARALVNDAGGTDFTSTTFSLDGFSSILNTVPTSGTATNPYLLQLADNQSIIVVLQDDGNWMPMRTWETALAIVTTGITARSGTYTWGSGVGTMLKKTGTGTHTATGGISGQTIYNTTIQTAAVNDIIQVKRIDGAWFWDVGDCG